MKTAILTAILALAIVSCEKPSSEVESKLSQLEKKAAEAVERQKQLEAELEEQKILAERDAIERERTLIEQERMAMEEKQDADHTAAANELERRQAELMERERKMSVIQRDLDSREQEVTGLESQLSERELELAGREPLDALPPIEKTYVSGPTGDFNNFYEPLGAYGSWFQTRDYGYVYQPTVVRDSSWRPYTRGRWAFTNQGWTWASSEPFGWACYHYGRWALLRNVGWVWVPGSEWAPAWVTWRESPGHIGWAPLPPETLGWSGHSWDSSVESRFVIDSGWFSFISYNHFGNDIYRHCLPVTQNIVIYHKTINITHYVVRDRRVFVGGPRYRNVCDRIGRNFPIHRLRLDQSPDFGRGGRRLNSQFSGNELQVVAPRMDADWNRALRPSRVSRDLGDVVVDRSKELPEDVRKQYRDRRNEEDNKAQVLVTNAGGRESFEKERKSRLEKGREEVAKNEPRSRTDREPRNETSKELERPVQPSVTESPNPRNDQRNKPNDRGSRRPVLETPTIPNPETPTTPVPEISTIPIEGEKPAISDPRLAKPESNENRQRPSTTNRLPRGVAPEPPVIENNPEVNRPAEPSSRLPRNNQNKTTEGPQLPANRDSDLQSDADNKATRELRQQQEAVREEKLRSERALKLQQEQQAESARQQKIEASKVQQLQEKQEKLNEQLEQRERAREQNEQGEKVRDLQEKQELARKEQQERLNAQQEQREQAREQQDKMRQQQAQQEETQRRLKEQQEQLRSQQEQQEKMRAQQEQLRAQQDQQERMRAQQEQARQKQEEAQRRMQEQQEQRQAQQEQQERMRAQQEQQERGRQQQEESQRRMQQQQEQQERARQQQEESERRKQERQK